MQLRAHMLMGQGRYDLAQDELRRALAQEPNDAEAHALLAVCLAELDKHDAAEEEARLAVGLAADAPLAHFVLGRVLAERDKLPEARSAAEEAIRLEPEDADNHSLLAQIYVRARRWQEALDAAERGLAIDAEHHVCLNLRALALTHLGRKDAAFETIRKSLADNPQSSIAHANQGWALLHTNDPKPALGHFREALRLDPENGWAKSGMVEALKARNPIYRWLLAYFLWMNRLGSGAQTAVLIGGFLGYRVLRGVQAQYPDLRPLVLPLIILYLLFILLTWVGPAFFNLLLRLNPYGRYALDENEVRQSNWFGGLLLATIGCAVAWWWSGYGPLLMLTIVVGVTTMHTTALFNYAGNRRFKALAVAVAAVAALGIAMFAARVALPGHPLKPFFLLVWAAPALLLELYLAFGFVRRERV